MMKQPSYETRLVENLKRHLISRDDKIKLETVQYLIQYLQNDSLLNEEGFQNTIDHLIEADVVEYLAEAMATHDSMLLRAIFTCLEIFVNSEKIATQTRAAYIIECIQRNLFLLFTDTNVELSTVNQALRLLAIFVEESHKTLNLTQLFGNDENIKQMLYLVSSLLKMKEEFNDEIIINSCLLFLSIFSQNDCALRKCDFLSDIPEIMRKSLVTLDTLVSSKDFETLSSNILILMIKIGATVLQFCHTLDEESDWIINCESDLSLSSNMFQKSYDYIKIREKILSFLVPLVENVWIPSVVKVQLNSETSDLYFTLFQCIKYLYLINDFDVISFSEYLAKGGFTVLIPSVLEWARERKHKKFTYLIYNVSIEFLLSLSEELLSTDQWLAYIDYKAYLRKGICLLPVHFHDWLSILNTEESSECGQHFVLIFLYFYCLFLPRLPSHEIQLDCLISYLENLTSECPQPILKALWLLFAEGILSQSSSFSIDLIFTSSNILLHLLEPIPCDQLYTHHPAILFWSFSSPTIPVKLQNEVLHLWLQKECNENYDDIILKMAFTNQDVLFRLLDIVKYREKEVASHAAIILSKAIVIENRQSYKSVLSLLWDMLPIVLEEYYSENSKITGHNITSFMQAICTSIPMDRNSKSLLLCARNVMKVLGVFEERNESITLRGPVVQIGLLNLLMAMEKKDLRVLLCYTDELEFLKLLYVTSGNPNTKLIRPCLQLLLYVNKFFQESPITLHKGNHTLYIDVLHILYLLIQDDYEILVSTLDFLYDVLTTQLPNPLIHLVSPENEFISELFLEILFRHLQNISCKNILQVSVNSLKAMGSILMYSYEVHPVKHLYCKLATQPWTHIVLRMLFTAEKPVVSCELLFFICWWMQYYLERNKLQNERMNVQIIRRCRAPCPSLLTETMERISNFLICNTNIMDQEIQSLIFVVIKRITLLDVNLSQDVCLNLRKMLNDYDIPSSSGLWSNQVPSV